MFGYIEGIISWTSTTPSPSELVEAEKQQPIIRENAIREQVREQVRKQLEEQLQHRAVQQRRDHLNLIQQRPEQLPRSHQAKASLMGGSFSGTPTKTPIKTPPPRSLAMLFPSFDNDPPIAGSSSLAENPAFTDNPFIIGNRKHRMSTEEREKYIMATDENHESNLAFYPNESSTRSPTLVASSPARIEVQQQQLTWVDDQRSRRRCAGRHPGTYETVHQVLPLSVVRRTSNATGRCVEDFRISESE